MTCTQWFSLNHVISLSSDLMKACNIQLKLSLIFLKVSCWMDTNAMFLVGLVNTNSDGKRLIGGALHS